MTSILMRVYPYLNPIGGDLDGSIFLLPDCSKWGSETSVDYLEFILEPQELIYEDQGTIYAKTQSGYGLSSRKVGTFTINEDQVTCFMSE
jgi:hypothetical protein